MQTKQECRQFFRRLQASFPADNYLNWNLALAPFLAETLAVLPAGSLVAAYQAMPTEAGLAAIFTPRHRFCFPRAHADGTMDFLEVKNAASEQEFVRGRFGLLEPGPQAALVKPQDISFCFVPMVAFDPLGFRLGQGKGYYDRFLAGFRGEAVGVAFSWQEAAGHLPVEAHDQPLAKIVTELGIREFA